MLSLEYFLKQVFLLGPALTKGHGNSIRPAALLVVRGRRPSPCRALHPRHTRLICSPSTLLTNFTGGWESNENSLHCMFI